MMQKEQINELLKSQKITPVWNQTKNYCSAFYSGYVDVLENDVELKITFNDQDLEVYLKFKTKLPNKHKKIIVKDLDEKGITMIHTIDGYIIFEVIKSYKELFYEISEILSTLLSLYTKERYDDEWINSIVNHDN